MMIRSIFSVLLLFLINMVSVHAVEKLEQLEVSVANRTVRGHCTGCVADSSNCVDSWECGESSFCYDGWSSDYCTQCTDLTCSGSVDNVCCTSISSSPSSSSMPSSPSSEDFSWANSLLSYFYPGGSATVNPGCSWSSADSSNKLYYGNCGDSVFLQNSEDKWCSLTVSYFGYSESYGLCLASSDADCCEVAPGPTAGIAIALILLLAGIIACICRCCRCFCFKSKAEAPQIVVVQAPAATASEK